MCDIKTKIDSDIKNAVASAVGEAVCEEAMRRVAEAIDGPLRPVMPGDESTTLVADGIGDRFSGEVSAMILEKLASDVEPKE